LTTASRLKSWSEAGSTAIDGSCTIAGSSKAGTIKKTDMSYLDILKNAKLTFICIIIGVQCYTLLLGSALPLVAINHMSK